MTPISNRTGPDSLWNAISAPGVPTTPLRGDIDTDVAIVGGGYSGLSAAHACLDRGVEPVVLEANEVGWGASGR